MTCCLHRLLPTAGLLRRLVRAAPCHDMAWGHEFHGDFRLRHCTRGTEFDHSTDFVDHHEAGFAQGWASKPLLEGPVVCVPLWRGEQALTWPEKTLNVNPSPFIPSDLPTPTARAFLDRRDHWLRRGATGIPSGRRCSRRSYRRRAGPRLLATYRYRPKRPRT